MKHVWIIAKVEGGIVSFQSESDTHKEQVGCPAGRRFCVWKVLVSLPASSGGRCPLVWIKIIIKKWSTHQLKERSTKLFWPTWKGAEYHTHTHNNNNWREEDWTCCHGALAECGQNAGEISWSAYSLLNWREINDTPLQKRAGCLSKPVPGWGKRLGDSPTLFRAPPCCHHCKVGETQLFTMNTQEGMEFGSFPVLQFCVFFPHTFLLP